MNNLKNIMIRAWGIARAGAAAFGGKVREYFGAALKQSWKEIGMDGENKKSIGDALIAIGGKLWESGDGEKRRVYFSEAQLREFAGLQVTFFRTGNVSSAKLNGVEISNSRASRIISGLISSKFHYDLIDQKFGYYDTISDERVDSMIAGAKAAAAAS